MVNFIVMDFLQKTSRPNPFKETPGPKWWNGFLKRWPQLSEWKAQHLSQKRAQGANRETMDNFFVKVEELLNKIGIRYASDLASRMWNCDESGLCNASGSWKVLAKRGSRWVHDTAGGSGRSYTTIHGCGSASGVWLPPFVVYKGKNLYSSWTRGGLAGAMYSTRTSGWMEKENYESWFRKMFMPAVVKHLTDSGPVVLFFDGHYSHKSVELVELARANNIHLMLLPSNTTHVLQPLDVGVYSPVKQAWKRILNTYKLKTRAANIGKEDFPGLLKQLWDSSFKESHLIGGFRETGLYPFNQSAIPSWKIAPALPIQARSSTDTTVAGETPLRSELRKCFIDAIKPREERQPQCRKKVNVIHYGEALTNDETIERLREAEEEKKKKKTKRGGKKGKKAAIPEDERHCQICGNEFKEGEEESCLGCDHCWRWVHCQCAGFQVPPEEELPWDCPECS